MASLPPRLNKLRAFQGQDIQILRYSPFYDGKHALLCNRRIPVFIPPHAPRQPAVASHGDKLVVQQHRSQLPPPGICAEGLWGIDEYSRLPRLLHRASPYLAFLVVPTDETKNSPFFAMPRQSDMIPHPTIPRRFTMRPSWLADLKTEYQRLKPTLEPMRKNVLSAPSLQHIQDPSQAMSRASICLIRLEEGPLDWTDAVLFVRALQRCIAELRGYERWYNTMAVECLSQEESTPRRAHRPFDDARGVFVETREDYAAFCRLVPTFMIIEPNHWAAIFIGEHKLSHVFDMCDNSPWEGQASTSGLRHRETWLLPPLVPPHADLEQAARGYGPRSDQDLERTNMFSRPKGKQRPMEVPLTTELRRIFNIKSKPPSYAPLEAKVWEFAMLHIDITKCYDVDLGPRPFIIPPIHLFWGASNNRQNTLYYTWTCISPFLLKTRYRTDSEAEKTCSLHTEMWRKVLGHFYWKVEAGKAGQSADLWDPHRFYALGGEMILGHEGPPAHELRSGLFPQCSCDLRIEDFNNLGLRSAVLFHLNFILCRHQFARHDDRVMDVQSWTAERQKERQQMRAAVWGGDGSSAVNSIYWSPQDEAYIRQEPKPYESEDFQTRRPWLNALRAVVSSWPGFPESARLPLDGLERDAYVLVERKMLVFYIETFLTSYGYLPASFLQTPSQQFHCPRHPPSA